VYTSNLVDPPEKVVKSNCWMLAGALFPNALIADRTALEQRPAADGSVFLVSQGGASEIELPGIIFRARGGPPAIPGYDVPFLAGLWMSSQARALLDNLKPSRQRTKVRRTLTKNELEEFLDKMLRTGGEEIVNRLRDQAREISSKLELESEMEKLSAMIGAMMGTKEAYLSSALSHSRSLGRGYDPDRMDLFETLRGALAAHHFPDRPSEHPGHYLPFFESYFSNFIEGTEFDVKEAYDIVFEGAIPQERPADAHDVLGTFRVVSDPVEMSRTAKTADEFVALLRQRHSVVLAGRPDKNPGIFKTQTNRAGESLFVAPNLVLGTLLRGFDLLSTLTHPLAKAIFAMFLVTEVHPFADGNGRIARVMMNAELHRTGHTRIMIPSVFRTEYLQSLRALTHNQHTAGLISVMDYAQRFVHGIDFSEYDRAVSRLNDCHAFGRPADAMGFGDRLRL